MNTIRFSRRQLFTLAIGSSLCLLSAGLSYPAQAGRDKFILQCQSPTPATTSSSYPGSGKIILSNNLARPAGKSSDAPGQLLYIEGRVMDQNCVPVSNAMIDIWQTDPFGKYRFATRDELLTPEPIFAGSGRAVTDNLGRYRFTTLFPGGYGNNAPHIHMRIMHPDFNLLDTTMYFRGDRRNTTDPRFKAFKPDSQELLLGDIIPRNGSLDVRFNITLKGTAKTRNY